MARRNQPRPRGRTRVLGEPRLRRRRLDREVQRPQRPTGYVIQRFDRVERYIHWANATLFGVMVATGATLYIGAIEQLVGRRELVKTVHVYAGLLLPVPVLAGFLLPRLGRAFRADARRLNRFSGDDGRWLRTFGRDR